MRLHNKTTRATLLAVAALAWTGAVQAQSDPEAGDVAPAASGGVSASAGTGTPTQITTTTTNTPTGGVETTTTTEAVDPNADDHTAVVGHFGVGFFGVAALPLTACDGGCDDFSDDATVAAPTIGVRYWLDDMIGIEGALGFHYSSTSQDPVTTSQFGFALHGGVPLALAHTGHFVFEVVPQLNFGIASGSVETQIGMNTTSIDTSGFLLEIGAKVGAEIHFGFIDLPQLSLQAMLGLMLRHENRGADTPAGGGMTTEVDSSTTSIFTFVDEAPWKLFTGSISAIYYFGG